MWPNLSYGTEIAKEYIVVVCRRSNTCYDSLLFSVRLVIRWQVMWPQQLDCLLQFLNWTPELVLCRATSIGGLSPSTKCSPVRCGFDRWTIIKHILFIGLLTSSKGGSYILVLLASPRWRWCPGEYSLVSNRISCCMKPANIRPDTSAIW